MIEKNEKLEPECIKGTVEDVVCYKPKSGFLNNSHGGAAEGSHTYKTFFTGRG